MSVQLPNQHVSGSNRVISAAECDGIARRVFALARGGSETRVSIVSWWNGELRWARNRVSLASDRRNVSLSVRRFRGDGGFGDAWINQLDDPALEAAVRSAERAARLLGSRLDTPTALPPLPPLDTRQPPVWSDATYTLATEARGELVRALIAPAEAKGMLSAGFLEVRECERAQLSSERLAGPYAPWDEPYVTWTQAECSMTVRNGAGTASGWAGLSSYDWTRINARELAARALEKCEASQHPVALEPGRYTVILEPQAVADLMENLVGSLRREEGGVWFLGYDDALRLSRQKLGLKVVDERISISHDPMDPGLGILNEPGMDMGPVTWIDHGVLTNLAYDRWYGVQYIGKNLGIREPVGYRMSGGQTSLDEMIRTTRRGLLVTRFSGVGLPVDASLTVEGFTRDGLWLIEDGKITKAVRNFHFTESPLFVLNNLEQLGEPVPVYRTVENGLTPAIVPPLKAHDFSFTSLIDAI